MQLELFKRNLQKHVLCANEFSSGMKIRSASNALKYRHIAPNHQNSINYLVFDLDYGVSPCMFENELNIAIPNLVIQNPENRHAHIAYNLKDPIHLNESSSRKPINYAADIERAYLHELKADSSYNGITMKNPLHERWITLELRSEPYDLNELADYVDLNVKRNQKTIEASENYGLSRNCNLFEDVRQWAYTNIDTFRDGSYTMWLNAVLSASERFNVFNAPLSYSEIKSVSKSVSRWTWDNYTGQHKKRGRDDLKGAGLDLKDKQTLSAVITNRQRSGATEETIKTTYD